MMSDKTPQLQIIHISDIHFGENHSFDPPRTPAGDIPPRAGFPTLLEKLKQDLLKVNSQTRRGDECPVAICLTGDLATAQIEQELKRAEQFIKKLMKVQLREFSNSLRSVFIVPGNHDVVYNEPSIKKRWRPWIRFHNRLYGTKVKDANPLGLIALHDRYDQLRAYFLCINSAIHVRRGKPDEIRGNVDHRQLKRIRDLLDAVPRQKLQSAIRVALIHHHPVLIPSLAESGRGYDAVHNSGLLLALLRKYGFHLILHGHKHDPHVFTEDAKAAFSSSAEQPILIASGGSIGSRDLPSVPRRCNCYNWITVKWHPEARQARIVVETRGLYVFKEDGSPELPDRWGWETISSVDRHFYPGEWVPPVKQFRSAPFDPKQWADWETVRCDQYAKWHGNMPVVEVMPSLIPKQAYEARCWIVPHNREERYMPVEVIWSAGKRFPIVTVRREDDDKFCAVLNYWGPMLIQGQLKFPNGETTLVHVYARMPEAYDDLSVKR